MNNLTDEALVIAISTILSNQYVIMSCLQGNINGIPTKQQQDEYLEQGIKTTTTVMNLMKELLQE